MTNRKLLRMRFDHRAHHSPFSAEDFPLSSPRTADHITLILAQWVQSAPHGENRHSAMLNIADCWLECQSAIDNVQIVLDLRGKKGQQLSTLPEEIMGELTKLTILDISDNSLTSLPDAIGDLTHLRKLNAAGNILYNLPASFFNLSPECVINMTNNIFHRETRAEWKTRHLEAKNGGRHLGPYIAFEEDD